VIAACLEFEKAVRSGQQVTGIVDRDYDTLTKKKHICSLLLFTDYACMEMYCFNEEVLGRFFRLFVRKSEYTPGDFISSILIVLQEGFLMRATNEELGCCLTWLEIEGQCKVKKRQTEFDSESFVKKYLNKSAKLNLLADFNKQLSIFREQLAGTDVRHSINGHDFIGMLAKYVSKAMRNKNLADRDVIERQLISNLDYDKLSEEPLFKVLLARVK
jgi:hypothetical protein